MRHRLAGVALCAVLALSVWSGVPAAGPARTAPAGGGVMASALARIRMPRQTPGLPVARRLPFRSATRAHAPGWLSGYASERGSREQTGTARRPATALALTRPVSRQAAAVTTPPATTISAGNSHACEIVGGEAYCWGDDSYGQLGNNSTTQSNVPMAVYTGGVLSGVTLTQISAGVASTCALSSAGLVYCWGYNGRGELGDDSGSNSSVPVAVTTAGTPMDGRTIVQVTVGYYFVCAVDSAGLVYCWGGDCYGNLGNGSTSNSSVPVAVTTAGTPMNGKTIVQVTLGYGSACAVDSAGQVYCWGNNRYGESGNDSTTQSLVPVAVATAGTPMEGKTIVQISSGDWSVCAVDSAGLVYCWGLNDDGQLGNNSTSNSSVPVAVIDGGDADEWQDHRPGQRRRRLPRQRRLRVRAGFGGPGVLLGAQHPRPAGE